MSTRPVTRPVTRPPWASALSPRMSKPVVVSPYGPPAVLITPGSPGPFTIVNASRRVSADLASLNPALDAQNFGRPYRIDFDVTAATTGVALRVDWCDVAPVQEITNVVPGHYHINSTGRFGGYNASYKFADFLSVGGTVTFTNVVIREIL